MTFVCQLCGDCCSTMGEIISIQEEIRPYEFRIAFTTGDKGKVTVEPDKRNLFCSTRHDEKIPLSGPFLRERAPRERICTVHASRPELCRGYRCFRILVLDQGGRKAGRVVDETRSFTTGDPALLDLWYREIRDTIQADDVRWEGYVEEVFTKAGYRVIR